MADSDSTNATTDAVIEVAGDLETVHHTLKILNDLTNEQACNWGVLDDKEAVQDMVERIIVLTNSTRLKLDEFNQLMNKAYQIGYGTRMESLS